MTSLKDPSAWSWDDLVAFHVTVQQGSLSGAAAVLRVSQPTVGRRIDALEAAWGGVHLLERHPGGCRPTALGAALLPYLDVMRAQAEAIQRVVEDDRRNLRGVVRITCGPLLGQFIARRIQTLLMGTQGLEIEVLPSMAFEDLVGGKADVAIRNKPPTAHNLLLQRLGRSPFGVYAHHAYVDSAGLDAATLPDGRGRWVGYIPGHRAPSAQWLRETLGRDADLRFSSSVAILEAVLAGAGVGVLPAYACAHRDDIIQLGPLLEDTLAFDVWMVRPASTRNVPRVELVTQRLRALLPTRL